MFKFIRYIFNILILGILGLVLVYLVVDPGSVKNNLQIIVDNIDNTIYQIVSIVVISVYFVVIILSILEGIFKKSNSIEISNKSGKIEVSFSTIENMATEYLKEEKLVKKVKVKVKSKTKKPIIEADIESYRTQNLNEKLDDIKAKLNEHISSMIGIEPKNIILKVTKIDEKQSIENEVVVGEKVDGE